MSSSRRRVGPGSTPEPNQLGTTFSDLSLQPHWPSSPVVDNHGGVIHGSWNPLRPDVPQSSRMKASPVAAESPYHESPPARHVIGQNRGSTGTPVFPPVGTPPKSSKESPKEVHERLTAEQLRQQYLSRILAMQLGHSSPGTAAPRLPSPFWPSQHPALFACEPTLGNPAFVAGKVPVIIGPAGPVAYDVSTMSAFGVPQLVPTFRAFRYQCCVKLLHETVISERTHKSTHSSV